MSNKQWFLFDTMGGVTIDLSLISEINWNVVGDKGIYFTSFCMGTNVTQDDGMVASNVRYIFSAIDRKRLQVALISLGLPTVELVFGTDEEA